MLFLLGSCKTAQKVPTTDSVIVKTVYETVYQDRHDSIYIDRWHDRYIKGDTVYVTDSIIKYKYKHIYRTDTMYSVDTVTITKTTTIKEEPKVDCVAIIVILSLIFAILCILIKLFKN